MNISRLMVAGVLATASMGAMADTSLSSKLQAGLPGGSSLVVTAAGGDLRVAGTVATLDESGAVMIAAHKVMESTPGIRSVFNGLTIANSARLSAGKDHGNSAGQAEGEFAHWETAAP